MASLTNKVALVTGGSRGIGAGIAKRLAADRASVAITYTKGSEAAASVVKEIERAGGKAMAIQADAADAKAVTAAVEKTVAAWGQLDVLVNNASTANHRRILHPMCGFERSRPAWMAANRRSMARVSHTRFPTHSGRFEAA
jgi:NAD(P)-dependent dehydrogenase (short-subunit alcohol dehydrogenase family)